MTGHNEVEVVYTTVPVFSVTAGPVLVISIVVGTAVMTVDVVV